MRSHLREALVALATAVSVGALALTATRTSGQISGSQGPPGPRRADGKPDFSGIWQAHNGANWDLVTHVARPIVAQPGVYKDVPVLGAPVVALGAIGWVPPDVGVVDGDEIPYQPWAKKKKQENFDNWLDRDPEIFCYLPGTPRAMYMPYKFQIIQGTTKIMMIFEFGARNGSSTWTRSRRIRPKPIWDTQSPGGKAIRSSWTSRASPHRRGSTEREISTATRFTWWSDTPRSRATRSATKPR